ncbi:hypothetical protein AB184_01015 (plasmid) [Klebsiella oxytoca]|uniref:hypothetical protein n=1 Tax=Klebsiella/Raoultella group TaxID=2890311 RepID=UPI000649D257|nr:hypothetical protein [Klebsiella oxytoca]UVY41810.1 MAG: hypothetical protein [Bacteriophage sp.]AKL03886.1 hypothetical protein AB184_01015 [Klebsiella oxytoca]AKL20907.1 hypothetical protein AB181_01780 [Klebsiella oxytoca]APB48252.1 hypothetical protein AGF18_30250 [Klebsiella oxytoca]HAU6254611.1 hypothetical protein [Klebsiella oxytoca]
MSSKLTGNQFGQIATCVAAARHMAVRFGGNVDFGSFDSHYKDAVTRQRLIEGSEALFDAQRGGSCELCYLGNVFGPDHLGRGVIMSSNEDNEITFHATESGKATDRVQHMSARLAVRRVQGEMARYGKRDKSRPFRKVEMPVTLMGEGTLYFGICFDDEVKTGFIVTTAEPSDAKDSLQYATDVMKKLADAITEVWPTVINGFFESQPAEGVLDEFSGIRELRKSNPLWGSW